MTYRDCPHDGKTIACQDCRDEDARRQLARRTDGTDGDGITAFYGQCAGRLHFASKALRAAGEAGADRRIMKVLEEFRDQCANTGD